MRPTLWVEHPFLVPYWRNGELRAALAALARPDPALVERAAAAFRARHGMALGMPMGSARLALELVLRGRGIGPGSEVILPTFACAALLAAVQRAGADPVFADVWPDLILVPLTAAAAASPRTRAVVVVHDGGRRADVAGIRAALSAGVLVVEDCAQATGAGSADPWGRDGDVAIWSFGLGKNLIATGGGFLAGSLAADPALDPEPPSETARRLAHVIAVHGLARWTRPAVVALRRYAPGPPEGRAGRYPRRALSAAEAAVLLRQLGSLDRTIELRRRNALALIDELRGAPVVVPDPVDHVFTKFHLTLRRATRPAPGARAPELHALVRRLLRAGFEPEAAYTPLHLRFPGARDVERPVAEDLYWRTVTLPVRPGIPEAAIRRMGDVIRRHLAG